MRKLALLLGLVFTTVAFASELTPGQIQTEINAEIRPNGQQAITGSVLNGVLTDIAQSYVGIVPLGTGVQLALNTPINTPSMPNSLVTVSGAGGIGGGSPWEPGGTTQALSLTTGNNSLLLTNAGVGPNYTVYNTGANAAYLAFGTAGVVATTTNEFLPPCAALTYAPPAGSTTLAGITAIGSTNIIVSGGMGNLTSWGCQSLAPVAQGAGQATVTSTSPWAVQIYDAFGTPVSYTTNQNVAPNPGGATIVTGQSGDVSNATATATLAATSGKTTYIIGFQCTSSGSTGASVVDVTLTGLGSTQTYIYTSVAGATLANAPLIVTFQQPLPAPTPNTAIAVAMPALGSGNAHAACNAQGFQM